MSLDEYCNHCAKKYGNKKSSFVHFCKKGSTANVMCKGCGLTSVDYKGRCLKCKPKKHDILTILVFIFVILGAISYRFLI